MPQFDRWPCPADGVKQAQGLCYDKMENDDTWTVRIDLQLCCMNDPYGGCTV